MNPVEYEKQRINVYYNRRFRTKMKTVFHGRNWQVLIFHAAKLFLHYSGCTLVLNFKQSKIQHSSWLICAMVFQWIVHVPYQWMQFLQLNAIFYSTKAIFFLKAIIILNALNFTSLFLSQFQINLSKFHVYSTIAFIFSMAVSVCSQYYVEWIIHTFGSIYSPIFLSISIFIGLSALSTI